MFTKSARHTLAHKSQPKTLKPSTTPSFIGNSTTIAKSNAATIAVSASLKSAYAADEKDAICTNSTDNVSYRNNKKRMVKIKWQRNKSQIKILLKATVAHRKDLCKSYPSG